MFVEKKPWPQCRGFFLPILWALLAFCVVSEGVAGTLGARNTEDCANLNAELQAKAESVKVKSIVDGDTLRLADGRKIRVLAINTPEKNVATGQPDVFALEAAQAVDTFLGRQRMAIILVGEESSDHYGRVLAHVFNPRGENLSAYLLNLGLGWHLAVPPNLLFAECLARIEQLARLSGRGVWQSAPISVKAIHSGGYQRVRGRLTSIHFGKKGAPWWLQFEGKLTAVIYPEYQSFFNRQALSRHTGQIVEVGGWIYPDRKKPQSWRLKLTSHFDIEFSQSFNK